MQKLDNVKNYLRSDACMREGGDLMLILAFEGGDLYVWKSGDIYS